MKLENELRSACVKTIARSPRVVVLTHTAGMFTRRGIPDVSYNANGHTVWLEFKRGERVKWENDWQRITCLRLEQIACCWLVVYTPIRTCMVKPSAVQPDGSFICTDWTEGVNHVFVKSFVEEIVH